MVTKSYSDCPMCLRLKEAREMQICSQIVPLKRKEQIQRNCCFGVAGYAPEEKQCEEWFLYVFA